MINERLGIEEVHRFANEPVEVLGSLRWDVLHIFDELKRGLQKVGKLGYPIASISNDSWGLDYVHLQDHEPILTLPYHYRDRRTDGALERAFEIVPANVIYSETGIQFTEMNTLYQLLADLRDRPDIIRLADKFLNIGDYFNYLFSGVPCSEETLASTTQLFDSRQRKWSQFLIEKFHLPARVFPEVVSSGTRLGPLLPSVASEIGLQDTQVVASCSHDTGAAVAAVPAEGHDWCYLSSGTWSLLGIETAEPIINAKSQEHNFTNELGYGGTIRFLKNLVGLWIVQECRRQWAKEGREYAYDQLMEMAVNAEPFKCLINPAAPRFMKPNNMLRKIVDYCHQTDQDAPEAPGEIIRCVLESLALLYRRTLEEITMVTGREPKYLHIVGGGCKNSLLDQLAADATQLTVLAGPSEATAIGNILVQAIALGHLGSLAEVRQVVRESFPPIVFQPNEASTWQSAYQHFRKLPL